MQREAVAAGYGRLQWAAGDDEDRRGTSRRAAGGSDFGHWTPKSCPAWRSTANRVRAIAVSGFGVVGARARWWRWMALAARVFEDMQREL
jgi:hypothetical protein